MPISDEAKGIAFGSLIILLFLSAILAINYRNKVPAPEFPAGAGPIDQDAPKEFTKTSSGLKYRILRKGEGTKPTSTSSVAVNYHGWLDNGKVFDSTYDRGQAILLELNRVIPGWTEGLQLIGEGGMIELEIPPGLGYGPAGSAGSVPPNATLHFLVELLKSKK